MYPLFQIFHFSHKYNRKETDKVHGVCNKGNFQSQSITGTISNSEQRNVIAFGKAYVQQFETETNVH